MIAVNIEIGYKMKKLDELSQIIAALRKDGKTVVHCHGVFDLLHPGHIKHFEAAKHQGDVLVVTITPDKYVGKGPGRPIFNERLRAESIAALEVVDYIAINEWPTSVETIRQLAPTVYCKGSDYADPDMDLTGKILDEQRAIESVGGYIHFTDEITFSSTKLINDHFSVFSEEAQTFLEEFRELYPSEAIINQLESLKNMKVLVIGDTIVDEYYYCSPLGKSPKENLIPARYLYQESYAGGVLAIANHIAGFCDEVKVVTGLGGLNTYKNFILEHLKSNVQAEFFLSENAPTVVKQRFVEIDLLRKLFEVQFMDGNVQPVKISQAVCRYLDSELSNYDLVVVGDYGHGFMDHAILKTLNEKAKFLAVNAQTNSANIGFNLITKYPRADYFCIDEPELRLAAHDKISPLEETVVRIANKLDCHQAVITRGHYGAMVYNDEQGTINIPVFSNEVIDSVGAGDAFLAITAPCVAAGFSPELVGFIGNAAGALAIRIVGNKTAVDPVPLYKYIRTLLK